MPLIGVGIEPHGVTRIFFDCRPVVSDCREETAIRGALERAADTAAAEHAAEPGELPPGDLPPKELRRAA